MNVGFSGLYSSVKALINAREHAPEGIMLGFRNKVFVMMKQL